MLLFSYSNGKLTTLQFLPRVIMDIIVIGSEVYDPIEKVMTIFTSSGVTGSDIFQIQFLANM